MYKCNKFFKNPLDCHTVADYSKNNNYYYFGQYDSPNHIENFFLVS